MKITLNKFALALATFVVTGSAMAAGTATTTVGGSASIAAECAVTTNVALAFRNLTMIDLANAEFNTATTDNVASGNFAAICTNGTPNPKFTFTSANAAGGTTFLLKGTGALPSETIIYSLSNGQGTASFSSGIAAIHPNFDADGTKVNLDLKATIIAINRAGKRVQTYADTVTINLSFGI